MTNPSACVRKHFNEFCHVVANEEEARELFLRAKSGPSKDDMERAAAGAEYARSAHTWEHRLKDICEITKV